MPQLIIGDRNSTGRSAQQECNEGFMSARAGPSRAPSQVLGLAVR